MAKRYLLLVGIIIILAACNQAAHPEDHSAHSQIAPAANGNTVQTGDNYADSVNLGLIAQDTLKSSPIRQTMLLQNGNHIHIKYGSPGVRGRIIWGGLVPYGEVWATGAHNATTVMFNKDVIINGQTIPAGTYAFFTIPGEKEWTLILNKNYNQHLADEYNEKDDVIRIQVKPEKQASITQRLTYKIEPSGEKTGNISVYWEYLKIALPFTMN